MADPTYGSSGGTRPAADGDGGRSRTGEPTPTERAARGPDTVSAQGSRHRSARSDSRHRRSHHRSFPQSHHARRRLTRGLLAAGVAILAVVSGVFLTLWLQALSQLREARETALDQEEAATRLAEAQASEIARLKEERAALVEGRLPKPLLPLEFETLIDLSAGGSLLRNIIFRSTGAKESPTVEYTLSCQNSGGESAQPRYLILVFNEAGIQTGSADVTRSPDWDRLGPGGLAPGETCALSGALEFQFPDPPAYFVVRDAPAETRSHHRATP